MDGSNGFEGSDGSDCSEGSDGSDGSEGSDCSDCSDDSGSAQRAALDPDFYKLHLFFLHVSSSVLFLWESKVTVLH